MTTSCTTEWETDQLVQETFQLSQLATSVWSFCPTHMTLDTCAAVDPLPSPQSSWDPLPSPLGQTKDWGGDPTTKGFPPVYDLTGSPLVRTSQLTEQY